jgi:Spy/CpxP family protein refolding chaperone
MENKVKTIITSLILTLSLVAVSDLYARPDDGMMGGMGMEGRGPGPGGHGRNIFSDLDFLRNTLKFSEEQITKIEKINSEHKIEMLKYRTQVEPKKEELRNLILDKNINFDKVRTKLKEISDIEIEIRILFIKHRIDIEKIMTAEQKKIMHKGRMERKGL